MSRRSHFIGDSRPIEEPTVNLTPLIDVVFVILIAFIVIAPLLELDRIELADAGLGPHNQSTNVKEVSPIAIHVKKDNSVSLNGQTVDERELVLLLKELKKQYPQAKPQVFHDKKAYFGTYQTVKNALEVAGFDQMDLILKPV